jgi:hypothetical protein
MPAAPSDTSARQPSGRRRTLWWVLGLILALVLAGVVVRTVVTRNRPPLASRPLQISTLDHPLILDGGGDPQDHFDPPLPGERAGIPAATVFEMMLRRLRDSVYDRAIPSSKPIPVTLARWSQWHGSRAVSPQRLVWLFQLTSVPCDDVGFQPAGPRPPPDRGGCDDYMMLDARSGESVGGFGTIAGAPVLRPA